MKQLEVSGSWETELPTRTLKRCDTSEQLRNEIRKTGAPIYYKMLQFVLLHHFRRYSVNACHWLDGIFHYIVELSGSHLWNCIGLYVQLLGYMEGCFARC